MNFLDTPRVARELTWTRPLSRGLNGADVKRMQEWLCLRGFATSTDGDFGPATGRALARFIAAERLGGLDVATIQTLDTLALPLRSAFSFDPRASDLRSAVLAVARQHAGQHPREVGGDNRGPWVRAYCGQDGAAFAWCAGSALSIVAQAAASLNQNLPFPFTLGCDEMAAGAKKANRLTHDPKMVRGGDLFICYRRKGAALDYFHTGIVTAMHADYCDTIEGNTNDGGSANGYELVARTRDLAGKDWVVLA